MSRSAAGSRGSLLDEIHRGAALRHVDLDQANSNEPAPADAEDSRDQLLNQIKGGIQLRKVCLETLRQHCRLAEHIICNFTGLK